MPDDAKLRARLDQLKGETIHTLLVSEAWDTANVAGEEVDVEQFFADAEMHKGLAARA